MPKFEKQYVQFMWDDELKGKKCFVSNCIELLEKFVRNNATEQLYKIYKGEGHGLTFYANGEYFAFAYYDPYYELKIAKEQGKTIQYLDGYDVWQDMDGCECVDGIEYRIKPDELEEEKTATNRDLVRWLAHGNGEWSFHLGDVVHSDYDYRKGDQDNPIDETIRIRKWDDDEWHTPTREYMGLEG